MGYVTESERKDMQIAVLSQALQNTLVALELLHMTLSGAGGVDLTDDQIAQVLNSATAAGEAALKVTIKPL